MNGTSLVFTGHEPTSEKPQAFGIHPGSPVPWTSKDNNNDKLQRVTLTPQALDFIQTTNCQKTFEVKDLEDPSACCS